MSCIYRNFGVLKMSDNLETEISFDLFHVEEKHHQVMEMISKIEKNVKVTVKITNNGTVENTEEEMFDPEEKLMKFETTKPFPIQKGFYEVTNLTDDGILDTEDLLDSGPEDSKLVSLDHFCNQEFVIKCNLCNSVLTNEDQFKNHNETQTHYMKYLENFCWRRNNFVKRQTNENEDWKNESLGRKICIILQPIEEQIDMIDIGGQIISIGGQVAAQEIDKQKLVDILMVCIESATDEDLSGDEEDSGIGEL